MSFWTISSADIHIIIYVLLHLLWKMVRAYNFEVMHVYTSTAINDKVNALLSAVRDTYNTDIYSMESYRWHKADRVLLLLCRRFLFDQRYEYSVHAYGSFCLKLWCLAWEITISSTWCKHTQKAVLYIIGCLYWVSPLSQLLLFSINAFQI